MRTTFYIHIGVPKTGTKSIQSVLSENREEFLTHGINFFPGAPNQSLILSSLLSDRPHRYKRNIRRYVDTPKKAEIFNTSIKHEITQWLVQNRSSKMVISAEGLSGLSDEKIDRLKQTLAPYAEGYRIIAYVRDPYEYMTSASLQQIKQGAILDSPDSKIPLPDYKTKLSRYIRAFGRENVDIRIFDSKRFAGGHLISDFLIALGAPPQLVDHLNVVRLNQSMSHEAAMILSETNRAIPRDFDGRANHARAFGFHLYVADIKGEKFCIDPKNYIDHEAEIRADVEWLNHTIGEWAFGLATPRRASMPRWSAATVESIRDTVRGMVSEFQKLQRHGPHISLPALPVGLGWLAEAYGQTTFPDTQRIIPQFDKAGVCALGCFLHSIAISIQHVKAERSVRRNRNLVWRNPRKAQNRFREVVRLNPANAIAQYRLSQAHLLRGHFVEAQIAAEAAVQIASKRVLFWSWLALAKIAKQCLYKPPVAPARSVKDPGGRV